MEIQSYIDKRKNLQSLILTFIDDQNNIEENFQNLVKQINEEKILENKREINLVCRMISSIASHHHRTPSFFNKIESLLNIFKDQIKQSFTTNELIKVFIKNKLLLIYFIQNNIIDAKDFLSLINSFKLHLKRSCPNDLYVYFLPEFKSLFSEQKTQQLLSQLPDSLDVYIQKRRIGENDNYICQLIRNDSFEEFISYVNQNKISLDSYIGRSIYETHPFLTNSTTLIEYSLFFGSIRIFSYLLQNNAKYNDSLWIYAIYCPNIELIHLLEKNNIFPSENKYKTGVYHVNHAFEFKDKSNYAFKKCLIRTFKCHHIDLSNYIINNYLHIQNNDDTIDIFRKSLRYYNFFFFPKNLTDITVLNNVCRYNYVEIVELILKTTKVRIESTTILNKNLVIMMNGGL